MTTRTFAPWVEPIAEQLRQGRSQIVRTASQVPAEIWPLPSPLPGWSYKDLLAHLAAGDWVCQTVLRAVAANEPVDIAKVANIDWVSEGNARRLEERKEHSAEELINEVEADGEKTLELLALLTDEDEHRTQEGAPMSLGDYLRGFPGHDRDHLAQLRSALDQVML